MVFIWKVTLREQATRLAAKALLKRTRMRSLARSRALRPAHQRVSQNGCSISMMRITFLPFRTAITRDRSNQNWTHTAATSTPTPNRRVANQERKSLRSGMMKNFEISLGRNQLVPVPVSNLSLAGT
jgi:hypothetical protein